MHKWLRVLLSVAASVTLLLAPAGHGAFAVDSAPAYQWSAPASGTAQPLNDIVFGGGIYVAVGGGGTILTSADGREWTRRDVGTDGYIVSVAWNGKLFAAVTGNQIITSGDGITWTVRPYDRRNRILKIASNGILFVLLEDEVRPLGKSLRYSRDAVTWQDVTTHPANSLADATTALTWDGRNFYAIGAFLWYSADGIDWYQQHHSSANGMTGIAANGATVIALAQAPSNVTVYKVLDQSWFVAPDGTGYYRTTMEATPITVDPKGLIYTAPVSAALDNQHQVLWANMSIGEVQALRWVRNSGDRFFAVGADNSLLLSPDGQQWTRTAVPGADEKAELRAGVWQGDRIVLVGSGGKIFSGGPASANSPATPSSPATPNSPGQSDSAAVPPSTPGSTSTPAETADAIRVVVNGTSLTFDVPPRIIDGRTMVPLRAIFEALGTQVKWDPDTQTITGVRKNRLVVLRVGQREATVDEQTRVLDVAPVVVEGRTLVPVRFIAESLGAQVLWDPDTRTVSVSLD